MELVAVRAQMSARKFDLTSVLKLWITKSLETLSHKEVITIMKAYLSKWKIWEIIIILAAIVCLWLSILGLRTRPYRIIQYIFLILLIIMFIVRLRRFYAALREKDKDSQTVKKE